MRTWLRRGLVALVLVVCLVGASSAQGPFTAQIQNFYNFLMTAPQSMTGTWTFVNLVVTGTCTGCGGGGAGNPSAPNTSVQFNNGGAFGGFGTWDGSEFNVGGLVQTTGIGVGTAAQANTIGLVATDGAAQILNVGNAFTLQEPIFNRTWFQEIQQGSDQDYWLLLGSHYGGDVPLASLHLASAGSFQPGLFLEENTSPGGPTISLADYGLTTGWQIQSAHSGHNLTFTGLPTSGLVQFIGPLYGVTLGGVTQEAYGEIMNPIASDTATAQWSATATTETGSITGSVTLRARATELGGVVGELLSDRLELHAVDVYTVDLQALDDQPHAIGNVNPFQDLYVSNIYRDSGDLTLSTTTSGNINFIPADGNVGVTGTVTAADFIGSYISAGTSPAVANIGANSCGTSAASIAGTDNAPVITTGATAWTACRVTFDTTAPNGWNCTWTNKSTHTLAATPYQSADSATTADVTASTLGVAADVITGVCVAR